MTVTANPKQTRDVTHQWEVQSVLKYLEDPKRGFGTEACVEYEPNCYACKGQMLIGLLRDYLDVLKHK